MRSVPFLSDDYDSVKHGLKISRCLDQQNHVVRVYKTLHTDVVDFHSLVGLTNFRDSFVNEEVKEHWGQRVILLYSSFHRNLG